MPDYSPKDQQTPIVKDTNREEEELLTLEQTIAGSSTVMTHQERQAFLKNSELGKKLGISHLM